jgi:hypothetical protein
MKINQKFAKKAMIAASLTLGVIGYNSIFNEVKAKDDAGGKYKFQACTQKNGHVGGECISATGDCSSLESCG